MIKPIRWHYQVMDMFRVSMRCFPGCEHGSREAQMNEVKKFQADALGRKILKPEVVVGMVKASEDMNANCLRECLDQLAKSHERLRKEFEGMEAMYNAVEARSE